MGEFDVLNSSLYFSAASAASQKAQKEQSKLKSEKAKKSSFENIMKKEEELVELANAGLPVEIAGLSLEEAVVYLKDAVDMAADKLSDSANEKNIATFRKAVGQFIKYIEKNNYEIKSRKRLGVSHRKSVYFEEKRPVDPLFQVRVIDKKLDELALMVLQNHADKLNLLSKIEEIKGLLVDFLAE
ncbi:MAG: YaaR family protein [Treponema sp.]|jgi:hypothetical protein|nr:YaaR family protein [Treponema sp.]